MIEGIKIEKDDETCVHFCTVESLSESIKEKIRSKLSALCEGEYDANRLPEAYSYTNTLEIFLDRYNGKSEEIKKGMIGELLCHLLIPIFFEHFISVSPFFNSEERSIKKGHDLIYYDNSDSLIWLVEVKSGELTKKMNAPTKKSLDLLRSARLAIEQKLIGEEKNTWHNALKKTGTSLKDGTTKETVDKILSSYHQSGLKGTQTSNTYNVILSSSLFHDVNELTDIKELKNWKAKSVKKETFSKCMIFSLQKNTYQAVDNFLNEELKRLKGESE